MLSDAWREVRLNEVVSFAGGVAFPKAQQGRADGEYPFFKVSDMNARENARSMIVAANWITEDQRRELKASLAPEGTVIFPKVGAALKTEKRRILTRPSAFDNNVMGLVPSDELLPEFLLAFMETVRLGDYCQDGVVPSVNQEIVGGIQLTLPPVEEQRRVADLVGFVGEAERLAHVHFQRADTFLAATIERLIVPTGDWDELPPNWNVSTLGDLSDVRSGITKGRRTFEPVTDRPFLRAANVQDGFLYLDEIHDFAATDEEFARFVLEANDILLVEGGNKEHVGRGWIWEGQVEGCVHQNHVFRARITDSAVLPRFIAYVGTSAPARAYCLAHARQSNNLATINKTAISGLPIPVPPLYEQRAIVARLDATRAARGGAKAVAARLASLRRSLLDDLMTGNHEIPAAYDRFLSDGAAVEPELTAV
jgi:type I restriction enzyme, S subunit